MSRVVICTYEIVTPTSRKRCVELSIACLVGGLLSAIALPITGSSWLALPMFLLAILAGVSSLWSP